MRRIDVAWCRATRAAAALATLASCGDPSEVQPPVVTSANVSAPLPLPQGRIVAMPDWLALDDRGGLWSTVGASFDVYLEPQAAPVVGLFVWPAMRLADGRVATFTHTQPGMNPEQRVAWEEVEWDQDGDAIAYGVRHGPHGTGATLEFVEARGADELYWGCFRRGRDVFRSGDDFGCPKPNPRIVRGGTAPDMPVEVPGRPGELGTCWDPVRQPVAAERLFPGCLALDTSGVLLDLRVLRPPVELARDVRLGAAIAGGRILVVHHDGSVMLHPGNGDRDRGVSVEARPTGPPIALHLRPVQTLFRDGVLFADGTAAMFWSEEQLLRPLSGFANAVEMWAGEGDVCVRTSAREVYCNPRLPRPHARRSAEEPLVLVPATYDGSRDALGNPVHEPL